MRHEHAEAPAIGASVRRTLSLGNYESICVEYPIERTGNSDLDIWKAIQRVSETLTEWAEVVGAGYQLNVGKGSIDRIRTEAQLAKQKVTLIESDLKTERK